MGEKYCWSIMNRQVDYSLILPCFNEASHFRGSVAQILSVLSLSRYRYEIIFVDDGSSDATRKMIESVCKKNPNCRYVFHKKNIGRGAAVATGILESNAPIVGYMDIDCEVSPFYIPSFVQILMEHRADIVIGKRIYRTHVSSIVREVLSVGYRTLVSHLLGTDGIDTESGYKFFDKKAFLPVLAAIHNQHWFWDTESIVLSKRRGLRIVEVPVLFLRRTDKQSSVRLISDTLDYVKNVWKFYRRIRKRPL